MGGVCSKLLSLLKLYQRFWIWNIEHNLYSFTNRGCSHCAVLKALHGFQGKSVLKARSMQFFLQNIKRKLMKFTRAVCWISSKISKRDENTTLIIFLFCHCCRSLLWCNYWRSLMLWNSTFWSCLKLTVQIQLALHPCNPFLIINRNLNVTF